jgi:hypothetical protein
VAGCAVVAVALATLAVADNYAYLATYPARVPPDKSLEALQGRYLASLPPQTVVRIVGPSWQLVYPDTAAMMAPTVPVANFYNPSRALPVIGDPAHDLAFLFYDQRDYLPVVQEYYPGGTLRELQTPDGNTVAVAYQVPARLAMARYGVAVQITGGPEGRTRWQGQVPAVGALPVGVTFSYPLTATWSGLLYSRGASPIRLRLEGSPAHATLSILNRSYEFDVPRLFDFGWTPISVTAQLTKPGALHLTWQEGDTAATEVPVTRLWPSRPDAGLAVALNGTQVQQRVDLFIGSGAWLPLPGSYVPGNLAPAEAPVQLENVPLAPLGGGGKLIRWEGEVFAGQGGTYLLEVTAGGRARVIANGIRVINLCDPRSGTAGGIGSIRLDSGWNPIQVTFQAQDGGIALLWTRPDGVREIVPPSRLRHTAGPSPAEPWPAIPTPISCADAP